MLVAVPLAIALELLLTGEPRITLPVAMGNFLTTDNAPWNLLMAVSTVYSIPPVVLYYVFKRYLVSGLALQPGADWRCHRLHSGRVLTRRSGAAYPEPALEPALA